MNLGLSLGPSLRLRQSLSLRQEIELRLGHKIAIHSHLISALRGDHFSPRAECPRCTHILSDVEVLKGFRQDPNDLTTACPRCSYRFHAKLVSWRESGPTEVSFYCPDQTLSALPRPPLSPEMMQRESAAVYRSAVFHFGGLKKAYAAISYYYPFSEEVEDWAGKVMCFLGQVPDPAIASAAGVSVYRVRKLRRENGIPGFRSYPAKEYHPED